MSFTTRSLMMVALLGACGDDGAGTSPPTPIFGTERVSFGQVNCGATAVPRVFVISNSGDEPFDFTTALTAGATSPYTVSPREGTVAARSVVLITVESKAIPQVSATTANLYGDMLTVTTSVGDVQAIALEQTARGAILTAPMTVSFAQPQVVGAVAATTPIALQNQGNVDATVTLTSDAEAFTGPAPTTVAAGAAGSPALAFFPFTDGAAAGTVEVSTDAPLCGPLPTVGATGTATFAGTAAAVVSVPSTAFRKTSTTTCVRLTSGHVACTGANQLGVRGGGSGVSSTVSSVTLVRTLDGGALDQVVSLKAAGGEVCAVRTGGSIYCWGNADKLPFKGTTFGIPFARLQTTGAVAVGIGYRTSCVVTNPGGVLGCTGTLPRNWTNIVPTAWTASDAVAVELNGGGGYVLQADGTVSSFGRADRGIRGNADPSNSATSPVTGLTNVVAIAGGEGRANGGGGTLGGGCAVKMDGTAWCWGSGRHGKNGDGTETDRAAPVQVMVDATTPLVGVTAISAGRAHRCAIATGGVYCWGRGSDGQLGRTAPQNNGFAALTEPAITNAVSVSAAGKGTCAALSTGAVVCWGQTSCSSDAVHASIAAFAPST